MRSRSISGFALAEGVPVRKSLWCGHPDIRRDQHTIEAGQVFERKHLLAASLAVNGSTDQKERKIGPHLLTNAQTIIGIKRLLRLTLKRKQSCDAIRRSGPKSPLERQILLNRNDYLPARSASTKEE